MTRWTLLALGAFALAACGQQAQQRAESEPPFEAPAQTQAAAMSEADFIQAAANLDAFKLQASQLAAARAQRQAVKDLAATIVGESQSAGSELAQLAPTLNVAAPQAALDSTQQAALEELRTARGEAFDDRFLDAQVEAHENSVRLYVNYLQTANAGALRDWAQNQLSEMRTHLASVQQLEDAT